ncbi:MAG: helicase C-terminal domain-containing protein [Nakamurella sp.]
MANTLDWLRSLDDDAVVALLAARPDLSVPAPGDFETLARRVNTAPSIWRALETVPRFGVEVLTGLVLLHADARPVGLDDLTALLGDQVTPAQLTDALHLLGRLALVRADTTDGALHIPYPVTEALGPHPAGLGAETGLDPTTVSTLLAAVSDRARGVLDKLAAGPPVGAVTPTGPLAPTIRQLVTSGLLTRKDATLVELPREVGVMLRGDRPLGELHPDPALPTPRKPGGRTVDATGAGQALQVLRQLRRLIDALTATSTPALKSGGLGVRETRRLARDLDLDEPTLSLLAEVLVAGNLVTATDGVGRVAAFWTPTQAADSWLALPDEAAWAFIAQHWLDLRRDPARAGRPDANGKPFNLLAAELSWLRGPADRRWVLGVLAELPTGSAWSAADLGAVLSIRAPLRGADRRDRVIAAVLREATIVGVVAFDALTTAGRALLAGAGDVAEQLAASLPEPVRTVLVQADLTVIAPGRLVPELAEELAVVAEIESAGSATVYRVTPASVRRALDRGRSAAELHRLFTDASATPIPQALTYLIDDLARRHGVLRAGMASSYLRCDDPVIIDQAIAFATAAGIMLRRLAPTIAITATETDELLTELRKAGMAPVAEDEFGAVVTLQAAPRRVKPGLVVQQRWREPAAPSRDQLAVVVQRMRTADPGEVTSSQTPTEAVTALREAAGLRLPVWIEYVNAEGSPTRRLVEPLALSGGTVAAFDRLSNQLRTFVLHRITGVAAYREN